MKKFLLVLGTCCLLLSTLPSNAQCGGGYTPAQLNWDRLDYYYNSGSNTAPYGYGGGNYISNSLEQTQRFAIGRNYVTIVTSASGMVDGENATHTDDIPGYTGEDAQFTPSSGGQTITMTFNEEVMNLSFTLYDVDRSQRIDFSATNAGSTGQNINVVTYGSSILTINNNDATNARITANSTSLTSMSDTRGTATITVTGPVKTFTLTISTVGSDATFWLSDINACVTGTFPVNYQQTGDNQPLQGPAGNQPDYFLVTPDNNGCYMVDPATGNATLLFTDNSKTYINSFAYDPYHRLLYYISENVSVNSSNRTLKRWDFNTGTSSTVVADITSALDIPTMGSGIESAGASFYDGALYLGIEGGKYDVSGSSSDRTRETIIWRIDFDASLNPTVAYQVFASDAYLVSSINTSAHDFGDFIIRDGVLYDFTTARNGSDYTQSKYHHYDMTTGNMTTYSNPTDDPWNGQAGMIWSGELYYFRNTTSGNSGVGRYLENGVNDPYVNITVIDGTGSWPGGNGDAAENFRPQVDFGDAPSSYDPNPASPASHAQDPNLKIGSNFDKEWVSKGQTLAANSDSYDDGLPFISTFNPIANNYLSEVTVFNNTGANATVCAWLDHDGNGIFDAAEGVTVTVPTSASPQTIWLYWPYILSPLSHGTFTYLRIRITYGSNNMTTSHAAGYFNGGEVEDYRVPVNEFALTVQQNDFDAKLTRAKAVQITWSASDENDVVSYTVEKSANSSDWEAVLFKSPQKTSGMSRYEETDGNVLPGTSYYRLKTTYADGRIVLSQIRRIDNQAGRFTVTLAPNPAVNKSFVYINSAVAGQATIELVGEHGAVLHKEQVRVSPGTNSVALPISKMPSGSYIVRVVSGTHVYSQSLIINK